MDALFYYVFVLGGMSDLGPCGYGTQAGSCHFEISLPREEAAPPAKKFEKCG